MSHNLAAFGATTAMMYYGEKPWHGLGKKLDRPATAEEAIQAASLDWEVEKTPLHVAHAGKLVALTAHWAVVRKGPPAPDDSPVVLGIVGPEYRPLQNRQAFAWFDPIVGEGAAIYHTAGALGNGERVWVLAKLPDQIRVAGDDITDKFLLLSNSHDGSSSVQVKFTPIRVVCQNTLTIALRDGPTIRVQHTRSLHERLAEARNALGIIHRRFEDIATGFRRLAAVHMAQPRLDSYIERVFPLPKDPKDRRATNRVLRARSESGRLFEEGLGNRAPKVRGTLWAAYNGVVEYLDHATTYRDRESRLDAIWFGDGYLTKARAYRVASASAEAWRN